VSSSFDLTSPDHFTAGAIGPPGEREFYVQGRESGRLVTLKVEKEQVRALSEYLSGLLSQLPTESRTDRPRSVALEEPIAAAWVVGSIAVGYDKAKDRIVVEMEEASEAAEEEEEKEKPEAPPMATARFLVTRAQAAAFVERSQDLMKAGRPICPMCSQPKDPSGHFCPRSNGHARTEV
jgi:uncharacterized repeat protein (TIGR03847 family)